MFHPVPQALSCLNRVITEPAGDVDVEDVPAVVRVRSYPSTRRAIAEPTPRVVVGRRAAALSGSWLTWLDDPCGGLPTQVAGRLRPHHALGYHPIVATRAGTGEALHARLRQGPANAQHGARGFIEVLIPACGAPVPPVRFDAGSGHVARSHTRRTRRRNTMAVRTTTKRVTAPITAIAETAWAAASVRAVVTAVSAELI